VQIESWVKKCRSVTSSPLQTQIWADVAAASKFSYGRDLFSADYEHEAGLRQR